MYHTLNWYMSFCYLNLLGYHVPYHVPYLGGTSEGIPSTPLGTTRYPKTYTENRLFLKQKVYMPSFTHTIST